MPFITQGKTNLTYILIVVILSVIVGGGILGYQYLWTAKKGATPLEVKAPEEILEQFSQEQVSQDESWVYRNRNLAYSLKLPEGWREVDCGESRYPSVCFVSNNYATDFEPLPYEGVYFYVTTYDKPADAGDEYQCSENSVSCRDVLIDNIPAAQYLQRNDKILPDGTTLTSVVTNFYKEEYLFYTQALYPEPCQFTETTSGSYKLECEEDLETTSIVLNLISTLTFD